MPASRFDFESRFILKSLFLIDEASNSLIRLESIFDEGNEKKKMLIFPNFHTY
jgi:hypothetical protein